MCAPLQESAKAPEVPPTGITSNCFVSSLQLADGVPRGKQYLGPAGCWLARTNLFTVPFACMYMQHVARHVRSTTQDISRSCPSEPLAHARPWLHQTMFACNQVHHECACYIRSVNVIGC